MQLSNCVQKIYIINIISQGIRQAVKQSLHEIILSRSFPGSFFSGVRALSGSGTGCSLGEQDEESAATWPEQRRSLCSAGDRGRR